MDECIDLPPGFRFHPTDEEIITHYLSPKVQNPSFRASAIGEVDLNKCEPWDLPGQAKMGAGKEWYFFCQRDRKYPTGMRTNRATEAGYWKATGKDKEIFRGRGILVGMKKTLVFYTGRAPKGQKSNWVMHEYRLDGNSPFSNNLPKPAKDEWAVSRVFHKSSGAKKSPIMQGDQARMDLFGDLLASQNLPPLMESTPFFNDNSSSCMNNFNFIGFLPNSTAPMPSSYFSNMTGFDDISTNFSNINNIPTPSFYSPNSYFLNQSNQCKVEKFPNHSMVSDDTGLSTDRNTEISSVVKHDLDDLDGPVLDLDNMWKC